MVTENSENLSWIVDSGATAHMCKDRQLFSELTPCENRTVSIGNGEPLQVHGIGNVQGEVFNGETWNNATLYDVYYVPELVYNLFSSNSILVG
ncbi:hypothetical protein M8J77_020462 [Diaphorina citri]|nr:hypothetical protein M8J77_020462 [Diaphorina citri]